MGILRSGLRGVGVATLLVAGATVGVACSDSDDHFGPSSGDVPDGGTSSSGGSSSGGSSSGGSSSGGSSSGGSSSGGQPDAGDPDAGPESTAAATPAFNPVGGTFTSSVAGGVEITSATPDATIFFTTNGTNPTASSTVYTGPISVTATTTIRAIAVKAGFIDSVIASATYTIEAPPPGQLSNVTISPETGKYPNPQSVAMSIPAAEGPATICYTIDGSAPTCEAATATCSGTTETYSAGAPIQVDARVGGGSVTVKAIACKVGAKTSKDIETSTLSFRAAAPTASEPPPGEVLEGTQFSLSTVTAGATIHYRTDGGSPNCLAAIGGEEKECASPGCRVTVPRNTSVKAIACKANYEASSVADLAYTVKVGAVTIDNAGAYNNDQLVAVTKSAPLADWVCFGLGAEQPACGAAANACAVGSSATPTVKKTTAVNAVGCKVGYTDSAVVSGNYTVTVGPISITPEPGGGAYSPAGSGPANAQNYWNGDVATSFALQTATQSSGATEVKIRYSTDGETIPTCAGGAAANVTEIANGAAIPNLEPFKTIRAIGCKADYEPSAPRTLSYADPTAQVQLEPIPGPHASDSAVKVTLTSTPAAGLTAADAHICYNVGAAPADPDCNPAGDPNGPQGLCVDSLRYDPAAPFSVDTTAFKVKAIACKSGVAMKSPMREAAYTLKMATPFVTDKAGDDGAPIVGPTIPYSTRLHLHAANEAAQPDLEFRYLTGAAAPTCATGTSATNILFRPANSTPVTYRIIACDPAGKLASSDVAVVTYAGFLATPKFSPDGGSYANTRSTSVTSTADGGASGAYICTTTDGSFPACLGGGGGNCNPGTKGGTVNVTADHTVVRAIACRDGFGASQLATSAEFRLLVAPHKITPAPRVGGEVGPVNVMITNGATPAARLCWSAEAPIDANCTAAPDVHCQDDVAANAKISPPDLQGQATNLTLHTRVCRPGFEPTAPVTTTYQFTPYSRTIPINNSWSGWVNTENRLATSEANNLGWLSWDANNVYFAWQGDKLTSSATRYFGIYLRAPGGEYTTSRDDRLGANVFGSNASGANPLPATGVNYHFFIKTDRSANPGTSKWVGGMWADGDVEMTCGRGGTLGAVGAFIECSVPRAALGLDGADKQLIFHSYVTDGNSAFAFPFDGAKKHFEGNMSTNIPTDLDLLK